MKKLNKIRLALLLMIPLAWSTLASGQEPDTVRYNQYGVKVNRTPLLTEERNGMLVMESKDQSYRIWYDVRVQVDGAMFFGDTYNPIGNGTSIRRARFAVKSNLTKNWYGELDLDFSNSELELKDAYLQYSTDKGWAFKAGNYKESFSMESTTTSRYLTFMERPMVVYIFAPSRHIGVSAQYHKNWFSGFGGVYFQDIGGLEERIFSEDHNKDEGLDEGYSFTGKMVVNPLYKSNDRVLHFGVAGSYRTPKTDAETTNSIRYSTRSLNNINRKKYLDTDDITFVDHATLTGFELAGALKNLRFQSEYIMTSVYRNEELATEKFSGFYVFGSYLLCGGKYNYNKVDGEFTQPTRGKKWGELELALRYDYLDLNGNLDGIMGGSAEGYTLGLNYYINNNVKVMLNYSILNHDRYANGKNNLLVGYDLDGNLTSNSKLVADEKGKAGEDFSFISIRFEVDF